VGSICVTTGMDVYVLYCTCIGEEGVKGVYVRAVRRGGELDEVKS
jgi:hypothetical protein